MRADVLADAMGNAVTDARYAELAAPFSAAMAAAGCTTVKRAAMWCAQLGHESLGLRYMREIADGSAYEGRADLGNVQPGDGVRFAGRGPIQITGRGNYTALSRWAYAQQMVPTRTFFVDNPALLESPAHGFLGAVWYWTAARPGLNPAADRGDIAQVTRLINGGTNGLAARKARYERCLAIGAALLDGAPAPSSPTTPATPGSDWFDMATREDLIDAVREALHGGTLPVATRADVGFGADQIMTALGFDRTTAPSKLPAEQRAAQLVAKGTDVGYLLQQMGTRFDEVEQLVTKGTGGGVTVDVEALAELVADRLFARVVAHGGLQAS